MTDHTKIAVRFHHYVRIAKQAVLADYLRVKVSWLFQSPTRFLVCNRFLFFQGSEDIAEHSTHYRKS